MNTFTLAIGFGLVSSASLLLGAAGFTIQFGVTNIFNLAYGTVMTVGMFTAYIVNVDAGSSIWIALLCGALAGGVVSWFLNACVFVPLRRRRVSQWAITVVTFALSWIIGGLLLAAGGTQTRTYTQPNYSSLHFLGLTLTTQQVVIMGVSVTAMVALHLLLRYTRLGKQMRATAANPELARTSGIRTARVTSVAWALAGLLCGAAGVTEAINLGSFDTTTGSTLFFFMIAAAVFGGVGQVYGAMLGAVVIGMSTELAAIVSPNLKDVIAFALLAATLLVRPNGLIPAPMVAETPVQ
jgi:branched-chain amino acid transport system permease protein/neutral amino acid transport system permease protein